MTLNQDSEIELDWLKRWALYSPQSIALQDADGLRKFSYKELFERSAALAHYLRERFSIENGDRVALLAQNEVESIFLFFALQRLGAIFVPLNFRLTARELEHQIQDSAPKLFLFQETYRDIAAQLSSLKECAVWSLDIGEDSLTKMLAQEKFTVTSTLTQKKNTPIEFAGDFHSPCMILYTSGTTGAPKGALITNKMLFWNSVNTGLRLNLTPTDSAIIFHPLFHTSGWNVLTTPLLHHGGRVIFLKKFDAERVLQLAESEKVSILFGVPTMMDMMAAAKRFAVAKLESIRYAIVGGEPMPLPLIETWAQKNIPIRQGFGLTEFGPNVFSLNEADAIRKIGSIGFPNFYVEAKLINSHGQECAAGEVGELLLKGPMCSPGYWRNEKATQEAIRDGWFHTGDLLKRDADNYFYVVGRKKEMYISGAENIYPAEIEQYLRRFENIHEAAVIGVKDEKWGEVGAAFYSTRNGQALPESQLRDYCQLGLAKYKIPKHWRHLPELPKGDSGKIQKKSLAL